MANNYRIIEGEDKSVYYIKEVKTDQIIASFNDWGKTRKLFKHLNNGGCFDGWTPNFFLKKVVKN